MSILGSLMGKILGHHGNAAEAKDTTDRPPPAPMTPTPSAPPRRPPRPRSWTSRLVLETKAAGTSQKLDWRNSIVDLMKLVGIDSSLANRKALARSWATRAT